MLLQRVLTALALLAVILAAVFGLSAAMFSAFLALVIGAGVWEWSALAGLRQTSMRFIYLLVLLGLMFLALFLKLSLLGILLAGILFWALAFFWICTYPGSQSVWSRPVILFLTGLPLFLPGWVGFNYLRAQEHFPFHLLLLLALVAAADIGAYFSGRAFGRHKLAAMVSPNKTWEGFLGGLVSSSVLMFIITWLFIGPALNPTTGQWGMLMASALVIAVFSVIGDLFESMIKRFRDVKDSGSLLPGHGGILDRIDGLTAAAPVYACLLLVMGPEFS